MRSIPRRTIFLALVATATFVWAAIEKFDVPPAEMGRLMLYCVLGCLATALLAGLCFMLMIALRKLWSLFG